jgi:hypothetical protein
MKSFGMTADLAKGFNMTPALKTFRVKRWQLAMGVSAALLTGVGIVAAASPRHAASCKCADGRCADGVCTPNIYSYGYYQTHWRSWPKPQGADESEETGPKLPTQVEPPAAQEDLDAPPRPSKKTEGEGVHPTGGEHPFGPPTDKPNPFKDDEDQTPDAGTSRPERPAAAQLERDARTASLAPPANGVVERVYSGAKRPGGTNPIRGEQMDAVRMAVADLAAEGTATEAVESADEEPAAMESTGNEAAASAEIESDAADAESGVVEVSAPRNLLQDKVSSSPLRAGVGKTEKAGATRVASSSDAPEPGVGLRLVNAEVDPRVA